MNHSFTKLSVKVLAGSFACVLVLTLSGCQSQGGSGSGSESSAAGNRFAESGSSASHDADGHDPGSPPKSDPDFFNAEFSYGLLQPECFSPGNLTGAHHSVVVRNPTREPGSVFVARVDGDFGKQQLPVLYGELHGIGQDASRTLRISLPNGKYRMICTIDEMPASMGDTFMVGDSPLKDAPHAQSAGYDQMGPITDKYSRWIRDERFPEIVAAVGALKSALQAGDTATAQAAWLKAHYLWHTMSSFTWRLGDTADQIDGFGRTINHSDIDQVHGFHRVEWELWHENNLATALDSAEELGDTLNAAQKMLPEHQLRVADLGLRLHEALEETQRYTLEGRDDFGSHSAANTYAGDVESTQKLLSFAEPVVEARLQDYNGLVQQLQRSHDEATGWSHSELGHTALDAWPGDQRRALNASLAGNLRRLAPTAALLLPRRTQE